MRRMSLLSRLGAIASAWVAGSALLGVSGVSVATEPFVDTPPPPEAICPAIEEDYALCSEDPFSGNCADFVTAAAALSRLYLFNVEREPDQAERLQTSIWWGCGTKSLAELAALLRRIDSDQARAVLQSEPYRSLPTASTPAAASAPAGASDTLQCESQESASERSACEARALAAAETEHRRIFEDCKASLSGFLRGQLVTQEEAWKRDLATECGDADSEARCLAAANQRRDDAMRSAFPQCGRTPAAGPGVASSGSRPARTGMLPARWTPPDGQPQEVPFSFEAGSESSGTMTTTLGADGERFHGPYVRVEKSTRGHLVTAIYQGWSNAEWEMWMHDPDGLWTKTGVSFGEFADFYTGKVVATLEGDRGASMRCQFTLDDPQGGLLSGGSGRCQISNGGSLNLEF
jgi:hypothetical protein